MAKCAANLRETRTRLGLSQAECATALGVAVETFRTWDTARRSAPEAIIRQPQTHPIGHRSQRFSGVAVVLFPSLTAISKLLEFCQVADDDWPMPSMEAYPRKSPLRSQLVDALGGELGVCRRGQTLAGDLPHAGPVKV